MTSEPASTSVDLATTDDVAALLKDLATLMGVCGDGRDLAAWQARRQQLNHELALADARWDFLQAVFFDAPCEQPDRFQRDCGSCTSCRARYRDGALKPDLRCTCDHQGLGVARMRPDFHLLSCPARERPAPLPGPRHAR